MGTQVTSSSGSVLEEPEIQKLQMQAKIFKENSLNKLNALKSTAQLLENQSIWYQQAFARLFGDSFRTFTFQLSQHMNNLETLLNTETLHEMDSKSALRVIKVQFESAFPNPTAKSMEVLIKILLMPLSDKTILDSHCFIHELKREMNDDLEYVNSLEKELDELESEKADFSNIYDLLLEECVSKDVTCSYLHSMSHLNVNTELQCMYLHKVKECECLALKLSKRTESVNKEVHNNLLKSFSKLEKHSISLELSLQHCKEQMKNNPVCKENASNVFRKEREQYHEIQDLKAQMQDKNMVINELKKLILVTKGKSVETQFDKPSVVRQPNAQRIPKPSVLGKPTPFSNSPEMRSFQTKQSVNKTNVSDGLFKPVTQQSLPQNRNQAVRNTNVLKPGMYRIESSTTQTRAPQLP
ncbi:hypothetical protein Tco_1310285 [Tanacetum coccineum]